MYLAAIAKAEIAERRARLYDMRAAFAPDPAAVDDIVRKLDGALERLERRAKD